MTIYFNDNSEPYSCFYNFSPHPFHLDERKWMTLEHYFQAQKFANTVYYDKIFSAKTAKEAHSLGRSRKAPLRQDWESVKDDIMRRALRAKFTQNEEIRNELLATNGQLIVHKTSFENYWGCGQDNTGQNRLGKLLVELRNELTKCDTKID